MRGGARRGEAASLRHMFPRVDAAETALGTGSTCIPWALSFSRARSVIQKLKYRLINGGSSFADFLKGLEYAAGSHRAVVASPRIHRKQDVDREIGRLRRNRLTSENMTLDACPRDISFIVRI